MIKLIVFSLLLALLPNDLSGQTDSLSFSSDLTVMGRRQTGNLDQFSILPSARFLLGNSTFNVEAAANYHLLEVNGFRSINDFWTNGVFRLSPNRIVYPFSIVYYGFADSYRIEQSVVTGAGFGVNVFGKADRFLRLHFFGGYTNIRFENASSMASSALGSFARLELPMDSKLNVRWEFHSYHGIASVELSGINNVVQLRYALSRNFHVSASHTTIFNNTVSEGIAKTNTLMMYGLSHTLNKTF